VVSTFVTQSRIASEVASFRFLSQLLQDARLLPSAASGTHSGSALHILDAHVDNAVQTESSTHGCSGDAMLTSTSLSNNALLAHPFRQQYLSQGVVDFVSAGVVQVLSFEVNLRSCAIQSGMCGDVQRSTAA